MCRLLWMLLPILALGAAACETPLGPGTEGPLVFGARVAGESWPRAGTFQTFTATLTPQQTFTLAAAIRDSADHSLELLGLSIPGFHGPGRYLLSGAPNQPWGLFQVRRGSSRTTYISRGTGGSVVTISAIDTVALLVAGTFSFTGYRPSSDSALSIADGTFRVRYSRPATVAPPADRSEQLTGAGSAAISQQAIGFNIARTGP